MSAAGASLFLRSVPIPISGALWWTTLKAVPPSMPCGQERHFCASPGTCMDGPDSRVLFGSLLGIATKAPCPSAPAPEGPDGAGVC